MFWKKTSFERKHLSRPFDNKSWYQKKIKLSLILTNPELFTIYWTCHYLFWFRFLKLLLIFYCHSSWREISILKKQFLIMPGLFTKLSFKLLLSKKKETIYLSIYTPSWLSCLHDLVLPRLLFEPASDYGKANKGWGYVEKVVETKLSMQ